MKVSVQGGREEGPVEHCVQTGGRKGCVVSGTTEVPGYECKAVGNGLLFTEIRNEYWLYKH